MSIPFTRLASQTLDNYDTELNDALKRADGIVAVLGAKGKIKFEVGGGENFRVRLMYGENTNVGFIPKNQQIGTADDEGFTMASVPQKVIAGSIVINQIERDQVAPQGRWAIGRLLEEKKAQFRSTWVRRIADALRQAAPGANDPYTLLPSATSGTVSGILQAAASASQAGTTGGISRAENDWWRNAYYNTSIDISAEAGRSSLYQNVYIKTVFGSSLEDEPDFGLCNALTLGDLGAAIDTTKRSDYVDTAMYKLGFRGIMFFNAMLIRDSSTRLENKVAFINTRDLYIKVLKPQGLNITKEMVDENNNLGSLPVMMRPFQHDIDSLNDVSLGYSTFSLVPAQLRTHGLADNIA